MGPLASTWIFGDSIVAVFSISFFSFIFFLFSFLVYISILLLPKLCCKKDLALLIIVSFFLRQLDVIDVPFELFCKMRNLFSLSLFYIQDITRYYIKFLRNSLNLDYFCETILICAKLCYITEIIKN